MSDSGTTMLNRPKSGGKVKYRTIDADQHLNPPHTFWADYLPERLREFAPKIERGEDADYVVFEGRRRKVNLMNALAGKKAEDWKMEGRVDDVLKGNFDAHARLEDMDKDGVDAAVLYGGGPLGTFNVDLYYESFGAYNRYLKDFCDTDRSRLVPVGYLPMRDVDESVRMLHDLAKMGFTAVNVPAFPQRANVTAPKVAADGSAAAASSAQQAALTGDPWYEVQYDQPQFDKFWAAACDLDIAITIHLGARPTRFEDKTRLLSDMLASKFAMSEPVSILIFGGVFDRFPKLRYGTIESGGGWMAFAADYMDRTWEKQRFWIGSQIQHTPSFYMEQNIWSSFIHDRVAIENRNLPGAKNVMWSSDYPHSETTFPDSMEWIDRLFAGVPEDEKHLIISENARRFFRVGE